MSDDKGLGIRQQRAHDDGPPLEGRPVGLRQQDEQVSELLIVIRLGLVLLLVVAASGKAPRNAVAGAGKREQHGAVLLRGGQHREHIRAFFYFCLKHTYSSVHRLAKLHPIKMPKEFGGVFHEGRPLAVERHLANCPGDQASITQKKTSELLLLRFRGAARDRLRRRCKLAFQARPRRGQRLGDRARGAIQREAEHEAPEREAPEHTDRVLQRSKCRGARYDEPVQKLDALERLWLAPSRSNIRLDDLANLLC
mmetsp:Transcript_89088/g.288092  ORF Transcript_89088/g.288092 Transcript_89088/m.288092 type:complete len:253 (-) Transcript_89088:790-1548(-)